MNLVQLIRGTGTVSRRAKKNSDGSWFDGLTDVSVKEIKKQVFKGTSTVQYITRMTGSKLRGPRETYKATLVFTNQDNTGKVDTKKDILCRCSCDAFYFWFSFANWKRKCLFGRKAKVYQRKTPISDPRYPPKNPDAIPGMCKHLVLLSRYIIRKEGN